MAIGANYFGGARGGAGAGGDSWKFFSEMLYSNILEEFYPKLLLHDMGQQISFPGHSGKTIHIRAWTKTNPVAELSTFERDGTAQPAGTSKEEWEANDAATPMDLTEYMGTLHGFGGYFVFDDVHMSISEVTETLSTGARQLGAGYAEYTEDEALKRLLDNTNGTPTLDGVGGEIPILLGANNKAWNSVTATDYTTVSDIYRVGTEFEDPSGSSDLTYAYPDGYYRGIIHPRVKHDLFTYVNANQPNLVNWIQTTRGQGMFEGGKIPVLNNVAIETSAFDTTDPFNSHAPFDQTNIPAAMGSVGLDTDVTTGYMNLFFAPGAFSNLDLANATPSLIIQPFGSGGATGDPLKRAMTIGIKGYQTWVTHQTDKRFAMMASASSI